MFSGALWAGIDNLSYFPDDSTAENFHIVWKSGAHLASTPAFGFAVSSSYGSRELQSRFSITFEQALQQKAIVGAVRASSSGETPRPNRGNRIEGRRVIPKSTFVSPYACPLRICKKSLELTLLARSRKTSSDGQQTLRLPSYDSRCTQRSAAKYALSMQSSSSLCFELPWLPASTLKSINKSASSPSAHEL